MLSPTQAWIDAMSRADVRLCFILDLYDGSTHYKVTSARSTDATVKTYPPVISEVAAIALHLDPLTRETSIGQTSIVVQAAWFRDLIISTRWRGKTATVKIGTADLAESDFLAYFSGVVGAVRPLEGQQLVEIECLDIIEFLRLAEVTGYFAPQHPLDAIRTILAKAKVPSAIYSGATLFPDHASHAAIGHFVIARYELFGDGANLTEPSNAWELAGELGRLCHGSLVPQEDGTLKFVRFDSTAAAVDSWTTDDFLHAIKVVALDSNIINQAEMLWCYATDDNQYLQAHRHSDSDSQTAFAYPGEASRILTHKLETKWLGVFRGIASAVATINNSATSLAVRARPIMSAGVRSAYPSGSQPADAKVSNSYPAYWRIHDEIVAVTALAFSDNTITSIKTIDPTTGLEVTVANLPQTATATIARGQLGTAAVSHALEYQNEAGQSLRYNWIHDITIPEFWTTRVLERFSNGVPIIEIETRFDKYALQIGDLITITDPNFAAYGMDGITTATKWEIISKEPTPYGSPPSITWQLARATITTPTSVRVGRTIPATGDIRRAGFIERDLSELFTSGLVVSQDSGLNYLVSSGFVRCGAFRHDTTGISGTVPASKDTYITVDGITAHFGATSVANGAAVPTFQRTEAVLAVIVSNGSTITSVSGTIRTANAPLTSKHDDFRREQGTQNLVRNAVFSQAIRR